jgi:tol-pal system protein YbgF
VPALRLRHGAGVPIRRDVRAGRRAAAPPADAWETSPVERALAEQGAEIEPARRGRGAARRNRGAAQTVDQAAWRPPAEIAATRPTRPGRPGPDEGSAPAEEIRDYEEAFRRYRAADYAGAIDRFQVFLQTHPSSEYADNALFWMGESYFKLNDYEQAAVAFDKVVKRFPNGNKVPDALYRQGVSLLEIGPRTKQQKTYTPAACQIFRRIADEYPNSERVPEARRQLEKCPT